MKHLKTLRPPAGRTTQLLALARKLFIPFSLAFLAYSAYLAGGGIASLLADVSWPHLLVAWLCWVTAQWIGPLTTAALARSMDVPLGYRELALISILRLPAKYLPGGIWQSVARFSAYRGRDVGNESSVSILVAEHVAALGTSMLLGGSIVLSLETAAITYRLAAITAIAGFALTIAPMLWIMLRRPRAAKAVGWVATGAASMVTFWCLAACAFLAYWFAVFGPGDIAIATIVSCYLLSWAAGFVVLFAPQGLGVFEWVAAQLLPATQPLSVIIVAVAGFRLVVIAGDLTAWLVGMVISRTRRDP